MKSLTLILSFLLIYINIKCSDTQNAPSGLLLGVPNYDYRFEGILPVRDGLRNLSPWRLSFDRLRQQSAIRPLYRSPAFNEVQRRNSQPLLPRFSKGVRPASLPPAVNHLNASDRRFPVPNRPQTTAPASTKTRASFVRPVDANAVRQRVILGVKHTPKIDPILHRNVTLSHNNTNLELKDDLMKNIMKLKQQFGDKNITDKIMKMVNIEESNILKEYMKKKSRLSEIKSFFLKNNKNVAKPEQKRNQTKTTKKNIEKPRKQNSTQINELNKLNKSFQKMNFSKSNLQANEILNKLNSTQVNELNKLNKTFQKMNMTNSNQSIQISNKHDTSQTNELNKLNNTFQLTNSTNSTLH